MGSKKRRVERAIRRFECPKRCEFDLEYIKDMPFKCKYCEKTFCTEHRLPEKHNCIGLKEIEKEKYFTDIVENIQDVNFMQEKAICKECNKIIEEIPFKCKECDNMYCYEHRSKYNHKCD